MSHASTPVSANIWAIPVLHIRRFGSRPCGRLAPATSRSLPRATGNRLAPATSRSLPPAAGRDAIDQFDNYRRPLTDLRILHGHLAVNDRTICCGASRVDHELKRGLTQSVQCHISRGALQIGYGLGAERGIKDVLSCLVSRLRREVKSNRCPGARGKTADEHAPKVRVAQEEGYPTEENEAYDESHGDPATNKARLGPPAAPHHPAPPQHDEPEGDNRSCDDAQDSQHLRKR
jgi:hypothetical protein